MELVWDDEVTIMSTDDMTARVVSIGQRPKTAPVNPGSDGQLIDLSITLFNRPSNNRLFCKIILIEYFGPINRLFLEIEKADFLGEILKLMCFD